MYAIVCTFVVRDPSLSLSLAWDEGWKGRMEACHDEEERLSSASSPSSTPSRIIRRCEVRLMHVDMYMASRPPGMHERVEEDDEGAEDDLQGGRKWPVVRLWGNTSRGQTACVRIHGYFPRMLVRPVEPAFAENETLVWDIFEDRLSLEKYLPALRENLESKMGVLVRRFRILSMTPFYGFHDKENFFVEIQFYSPAAMKKLVDLVQVRHGQGGSSQ
jgi:hypothetical protein